MAEWLKAAVLKTVGVNNVPGFKSQTFLHLSMNLHRIFFPDCSQVDIDRLREQLGKAEEENTALRMELKQEITWNRNLADRMINFGLTSNGQFGLPPREPERQSPVKNSDGPYFDMEREGERTEEAIREAQIEGRVLELEQIYEQRGRSVPRPAIREMVEKNFVYLMDDDRVEI